MQIIDGKGLAKTIKEEIALEVTAIKANGGKTPHLAAILVGENPASAVYVRNKVRSCEQVGFNSTLVRKEATITQEELLEFVESMQAKDLEKIKFFFDTMPKMKKDIEFKCNKCGHEETIELEGIQNFFV